MRRNEIAVAVVLGVTALIAAFGGSTSLGRSDPAPAADSRTVYAAAGSFTAAARSTRVRYLESDATPIGPGAADGFSFTCPRRTPRAIGGYGGTARAENAGDIVVADSTPFRNGRSWSVGVKNLSGEPREFFVGVVCVR